MSSHRSAKEVFEDHLRLGREGSAEEDLPRNYSENVVVLTGRGVYHGHDGLQKLVEQLREELPDARFEYRTTLIEGEVAFLEWAATSATARVEDGADSFVIREGRIVAQTIHYTINRGRIAGEPGSPAPSLPRLIEPAAGNAHLTPYYGTDARLLSNDRPWE